MSRSELSVELLSSFSQASVSRLEASASPLNEFGEVSGDPLVSPESLETIRPVAWPSVSPYMCHPHGLIRPMARPSVSPYSQEYLSPKSTLVLGENPCGVLERSTFLVGLAASSPTFVGRVNRQLGALHGPATY